MPLVKRAHAEYSCLFQLIKLINPLKYDLHTRIVEMQILEKSPSSEHLPVYAKFMLDIRYTINNSSNVSVGDESIPFVKDQWAKASDSDIGEYRRGP